MEKEILELYIHDKVVIGDGFTGQCEEEIYEANMNDDRTMAHYQSKNFEIDIKYKRTFVYKKGMDMTDNANYDFHIIEAKRPVDVIENGIYKTIEVTFWKNGKYIDLIDLSKYGENLQIVKEDNYKRKYEDLVCLLSCAKKQFSLNGSNKVQTLVLDFSEMNPNIKQDIYKLIVKEK